MTTTLRLFTIEARRSIALWFFPLMALAAAWYANDRLTPVGVALWRQSSAQIGETLIILAPLMSGVAAWAAGRDRRRGIDDLLETTPRPIAQRVLAGWGSLVLWGVLAYIVVGVLVIAVSLRDDAWGSPMVQPVMIGLLTIVAASAIGYLIGSIVPYRLVPPLVPIALFYVIALLNSGWFLDDPVSFLSPWTIVDRHLFQNPNMIFYEPLTTHLLPMSLWLSGLTGLALTAVVLSRRRRVAGWSALACSGVVAAIGAMLLLSAFDDGYVFGVPWERSELKPYTPVCVERSIPICVHPAFEPKLAQHADRIDLLIQPLADLAGSPVRAAQLPYANGMYADGTLTIDPVYSGVETAALALVQPPVEPGPGWKLQHEPGPAQAVIARWLAQRVDPNAFAHWQRNVFDPVQGVIPDPMQTKIDAAVARFSALDPAEQHAWLEANIVDLRAGRLELEDLP